MAKVAGGGLECVLSKHKRIKVLYVPLCGKKNIQVMIDLFFKERFDFF